MGVFFVGIFDVYRSRLGASETVTGRLGFFVRVLRAQVLFLSCVVVYLFL